MAGRRASRKKVSSPGTQERPSASMMDADVMVVSRDGWRKLNDNQWTFISCEPLGTQRWQEIPPDRKLVMEFANVLAYETILTPQRWLDRPKIATGWIQCQRVHTSPREEIL